MSEVAKSPARDTTAADEPWQMDLFQRAFEQVFAEARDKGDLVRTTPERMSRVLFRSIKDIARDFEKSLMARAPKMLMRQRKDQAAFERRNLRRWRTAFDLIEIIWVSCEELGSNFNQCFRPHAVRTQDYTFEALTYLHAKALLVVSEMICLMKGGFADAALTRWRTLHEINVIAFLIRREGQGLALRYLAHSRVQAWKAAQSDDEPGQEAEKDAERLDELKAQADYAIAQFGEELNRTNGWACQLTGQKNPTVEMLAKLADKSEERSLYKYASLHVHGNHRALDDLLGMSESEEKLHLVGPSNSGMVEPLTLAAFSLVENTTMLLLTKPNLDMLSFCKTIQRMASRMPKLAKRLEQRTLETARKRRRKMDAA